MQLDFSWLDKKVFAGYRATLGNPSKPDRDAHYFPLAMTTGLCEDNLLFPCLLSEKSLFCLILNLFEACA